jgi:hypothetical protein
VSARAGLLGAGLTVALLAAAVSPAAADVDEVLGRAVAASRDVAHEGRVTVVSFGERGPQVAELHVRRSDDEVRIERDRDGQLVTAAARGELRAADRLLRVAGLAGTADQLERLRAKYTAELGGGVTLDTGPAVPVELVERERAVRREVLYLDDATGIVVRRETFDREGQPVRVVAYTELVPLPGQAAVSGTEPPGTPPPSALVADLVADGFVVPDELAAGYRLLGATVLPDAAVPTVHLLYGDGIYTLSVFEQRGRMASAARTGAAELTTDTGGTVWRWPGSEPRRLVWSGDGLTFTVLTDAPTDEALLAVGGLPSDRAGSILDRLSRGFHRLGRWFAAGDDDEIERSAP